MSCFQAINTVGGKNLILHHMTVHYEALAHILPQIDTHEPASRAVNKKQPSNKITTLPLGYKRAKQIKDLSTKTMDAVKRIKEQRIGVAFKRHYRKCSKAAHADPAHKDKDKIKIRPSDKSMMREHKKMLKKMAHVITNLNDGLSIHYRKKNQFDPIAYPVTLFRRDTKHQTRTVPCLSSSSQSLGQLVKFTDFETRILLKKSARKRSRSRGKQVRCCRNNSAPGSSRLNSLKPYKLVFSREAQNHDRGSQTYRRMLGQPSHDLQVRTRLRRERKFKS